MKNDWYDSYWQKKQVKNVYNETVIKIVADAMITWISAAILLIFLFEVLKGTIHTYLGIYLLELHNKKTDCQTAS